MLIEITYNVTDVYMSTTETPVYVEISFEQPGGTSAVWGSITGTLSNQTDLQNALNAKFDDPTGTTAQYLRGDGSLATFPSLTGFVPYTGATTNVDLGEYELKAGQLTLDVSPTGTAAVGTTRWNDTTGVSETTLKGGNVLLRNGVDLVARVVNKVTPNTTLTKAAYQAVRVSGAQGQRLAVAFAQANNDANSADTIGLVIETIPTNQEGFIMAVGQLENINTTGSLQGETWVDGDVLYLSPTIAGAITNVKPTGGGHLVIIGYVEYAHANNGKIYVKVANGWEITELHDVDIVSPANNEALIYESSSALWKNKSISTALGYTPANAATTLTINGVTYDLSTSRTWTVAAGISGSGTAGQVTYWSGSSAVSGSNNLFWDAAQGRLGIGTNAPVRTLNVNGRSLFGSATNPQPLGSTHTVDIVASSTDSPLALIGGSGNLELWKDASPTRAIAIGMATPGTAITNDLYFSLFNGTSWSTRFVITNSTGNISIGTTSDLGVRLGVVGDTLLRGSGATSATTALTVQNSSSTNLLRVFNNGSVQINGVLTVSSDISSSGNYVRSGVFESTRFETSGGFGILLSTGNSGGVSIFHQTFASQAPNGNVNGLSLSYRFGGATSTFTNNSILINNTINQTSGTGITRGIYINPTLTLAADWRSIQWDNNTGWGLYGAGTATNYLAGPLTIGESTIGTNILNIRTNLTGGTIYNSVRVGSLVLSDVTNIASAYRSQIGTQNATFTLSNLAHFYAVQGTLGASSTVNYQYGFWADGTLTGAAFGNYGFYGNIASGTGRWNLYMNGTADNYLAGNLGIGVTPTVRLQVSGDTLLRGSGNTSTTTALIVHNSSSASMLRVRNDGRVSINTSSHDEVLHVSGDALLDGTYPFYALRPSGWGGGGNRFYFQAGVNETGQTVGDYTAFVAIPTKGFSFLQGTTIRALFHTSGNVIIGGAGSNNNDSAILNIVSTTKGFLPPRMTTTQKNAIATPAAGLVVYDTTLNKLCVYTTAWETITSI